jgi:hypothetical protein
MRRLFDRVETTCPALFSPPGWPVAKEGALWARRYVANDLLLFASKGRVFYSRYDFGPFDVDLGSIADWETGRPQFVCRRPIKHFMNSWP